MYQDSEFRLFQWKSGRELADLHVDNGAHLKESPKDGLGADLE